MIHLVVAGTYVQFVHHVNELEKGSGRKLVWKGGGQATDGEDDYRFINEATQMLGFSCAKVDFVGTWESLRDVEAIKNQVYYCELGLKKDKA